MAELSVAETMPRAYRRVLDAADRLERLGGRPEASRLRTTAIRIYSGPWDTRGRRQLENVADRAEAAVGDCERGARPRVA